MKDALEKAMDAKKPAIVDTETDSWRFFYPADQNEGAVTTILPDGNELTLYMRDVDIENADRLKQMQGLTVLESIREIEGVVKGYCGGE